MPPLDPTVAAGRNAVRRALSDLGPGSRIVVAVSGGADSLALASVTAFVADPWTCLAIGLLIVLGGLGFPVLAELAVRGRPVTR